MLCSPILDYTLIVHEDQVVNRVGIEKQTCNIIYDEYVWEYEEELAVKDDLLPSTPHPPFPYIFGDSAIIIFPHENSFLDALTSDHSQNTSAISLSLHSEENKSFLENSLNISSVISRNVEGEHSYLSSTPLYD